MRKISISGNFEPISLLYMLQLAVDTPLPGFAQLEEWLSTAVYFMSHHSTSLLYMTWLLQVFSRHFGWELVISTNIVNGKLLDNLTKFFLPRNFNSHLPSPSLHTLIIVVYVFFIYMIKYIDPGIHSHHQLDMGTWTSYITHQCLFICKTEMIIIIIFFT